MKRYLAGLLLAAGLFLYAGIPVSNTPLSVANLTALQNTSILAGAPVGYVIRVTDGTVGAPPMKFQGASGSCSSASLTNDGASCVDNTTEGSHWVGQFPPSGADVRQWSADPTGATDATTAVQNALNDGPAIIQFPAGTYSLSTLTMNKTGQQLVCASPRSTLLSQNATSGALLTLSGLWNSINHCGFQPSVRTTSFQVAFTHTCYRCSIDDFEMSDAFDGVEVLNGGTSVGSAHSNSTIGSMLGSVAILYQGSASFPASSVYVTNVLVNNAYPVTPATFVHAKTWGTSTAFVSGDIVNTNNAIYQETAATCTSANSGTGPTGYPAGTSPSSAFTGTIADGTCTWKFVNDDETGFFNNSWGYSAALTNLTVLNIYGCITFNDSNSPGTDSYPSFATITNPSCDHNYHEGIWLHAGFDIDMTTPWSGSITTGSGIFYDAAFTGKSTVVGGRIVGNAQDGVHLAAGTGPFISVSGAEISSNGQVSSGTLPNVHIASGVGGFQFIGDTAGKDPQALSNSTTYGIEVDAGASDYYTISGTICNAGNNTGCVFDGGTGSHKYVPSGSNN